MARQIDLDAAKALLEEVFVEAVADFAASIAPTVSGEVETATERLMRAKDQGHREAAVGCAISRILDPEIDLHLPYVNLGEFAYHARDLDEQVVNPFFQNHQIPSSKGVFLNMFRRSVTFTPETRKGVRDKRTFDALLTFIEQLLLADRRTARTYLRYLLVGFAKLRDNAAIEIRRVARLSMEQLLPLVAGLLATPSGGLIPVLLSVAMFRTLRDCYDLDWDIEQQGINVSDRASGAGGDITIRRDGQVLMAIEVTERPIERARVVSTFNTKISPNGLADYLFIFSAAPPSDDAKAQAGRYFAAGHEINFVAVQDWIVTTLTTIGQHCRARFTSNFIDLLTEMAVPAAIKVAWNAQVVAIVG